MAEQRRIKELEGQVDHLKRELMTLRHEMEEKETIILDLNIQMIKLKAMYEGSPTSTTKAAAKSLSFSLNALANDAVGPSCLTPCSKDDQAPSSIKTLGTNGFVVPPDWKTSGKFKDAVRKGIPPGARAQAWTELSTAAQLLKERPKLFEHAVTDTYPWMQDMVGDTIEEKLRAFQPRDLAVPNFGGELPFNRLPLSDVGQKWVKMMLIIVSQTNAQVTFCPCLPTLLGLILMYLDPSVTYGIAKCLLSASTNQQHSAKQDQNAELQYKYVPTSMIQFTLFLNCFYELAKLKLGKLRTMKAIDQFGVNLKEVAEEWFKTFFTNALPLALVLQIFDAFVLEGDKVLLRAGLGIIRVLDKYLGNVTSGEELKSVLLTSLYKLDDEGRADFMKQSFGIFLKRVEIDGIEARLKGTVDHVTFRREGVYFRPQLLQPSQIASPNQWEQLFQWLPASVTNSSAQLSRLFSTTTHGFALISLYHSCSVERPMILLVKAFADKETFIFGMYSSTNFRNTHGLAYGCGTCFVFTFAPVEKRYRWVHFEQCEPAALEEQVLEEPEEAAKEMQDVNRWNRRFICGRNDRLDIGSGNSGPAIRLPQDLSTVLSFRSQTFDNDAFSDSTTMSTQTIEVYTLT